MILYLEALAAIALSLSLLMALAWMVRERTGNSGWVDTIWTFSLGLVGATSACGKKRILGVRASLNSANALAMKGLRAQAMMKRLDSKCTRRNFMPSTAAPALMKASAILEEIAPLIDARAARRA